MFSLIAWVAFAKAEPVTIKIQPDKILHPVSKDLYGIFFEEINCAGDGGIYPELVRNRSFDESDKPDFWEIPSYLHPKVSNGKLYVQADENGDIENKGFWGMNLEKGKPYTLTITGDFPEKTDLMVQVLDNGQPAYSTEMAFNGGGQTKTAKVTVNKDIKKGSLALVMGKGQKAAFDYVSLYPTATYKNRTNGLRPGLMNMLVDMGPSFMRFPGGCWVEGDRMAQAYRWKTTITSLDTRRNVPNLWGYKSTNGLGYHEYLQMCEDLGAAPLFVVNCGMSHKEVVPMSEMDEYVQDAVDAVEYANGPVNSKWGAIRAANGHPKPFNLKYLEIGNENGGAPYAPRYRMIYDAVKKRFPEVITIADVWGGTPDKSPIETVDEHYYSDPTFFFRNANRYDSYDRKGPKVYVGEYAVTQGSGTGNLIGALGEAAFMTGMERNSDHVVMASYAPLFANVNAKAWNPDLIYFDAKDVYGTPSYYVQKLFAQNKPTHIVASQATSIPEDKLPFPTGGFGVGTWATQAEFKDIQITSAASISVKAQAGKTIGDGWSVADGVIKQTGDGEGPLYVFPFQSNSYSLKLKAKKTGGREGFLIACGFKDSRNFVWFNLGGWGNSQHGIEYAVDGGKNQVGRHINGTIETGRWYDIAIDYSPERIVCRLDGKVLFDEKPSSSPKFFYTAGLDKNRHEVVIKAVQAGPTAQPVVIDIAGAGSGSVRGTVLANSDPKAENSLANPKRVSPTSATAKVTAGKLSFTARPYSVSIWRIPVR